MMFCFFARRAPFRNGMHQENMISNNECNFNFVDRGAVLVYGSCYVLLKMMKSLVTQNWSLRLVTSQMMHMFLHTLHVLVFVQHRCLKFAQTVAHGLEFDVAGAYQRDIARATPNYNQAWPSNGLHVQC